MENNVNNNVSNVNPNVVNNNVGNSTNVVNGVPVNPGNVAYTNSGVVNPTNVTPIVQNINPNGEYVQPASTGEQKSYKKFYIWMGVIVGTVMMVACVLLFFLVSGDIENRNRMTCIKNSIEDGFDYQIKKYFTFDNKKMVRVYYTYSFDYHDELTDDMYNKYFDEILNIDNNVGSTKYGLNTNIQKKGNLVEINSYEPNYYGEYYKDILKDNTRNGYTCE